MINASYLICRTAGCPTFGDWAIEHKLTHKWGDAKRGDIVLFDFNRNGTSDHIGIVTKVTSSYIETIEGNTGNGSNTNGDGVYRRTRYKSNVNYFVRPRYDDKVTAEMVIKTAEAELGYREGKNNDNKYGKWYGLNWVSWCCIFVVWIFSHVQNEKAKDYGDIIRDKAVELSYKPKTTANYRYPKGKPKKAYKEALDKAYPNRGWSTPAHKGASCDVFVGTVVRATGLDKSFPRGFDEQWDYCAKSKHWKTVKPSEAKYGDIIQYWKNNGGCHTCIITGKYVAEASYGDFYPIRRNVKRARLSSSGKKKVRVYRYKK